VAETSTVSRRIIGQPSWLRPLLASAHLGEMVCITALDKTQAEEVLDWLENNGCKGVKLSYVAGRGFTVSYWEKV
jgi:hypothetical protein